MDDQTRRIQLYGPFIPTASAYISPEDGEPEQKRVRVEATLHVLEFVKKIGVATDDIRPRFGCIVPQSSMYSL
jgi:hypothetical protein